LPRPPRLHAVALLLLIHVGAGEARATEPPAAARKVAPVETTTTASPTPLLDPRPSWLVPSLHALGMMTAMRATEAYLWPEPFAETHHFELARHYHAAFTQPPLWDTSRPWFEADGDRWQINVIGHGLFGSELYLRARTCQRPPWQALLFTGLASTAWEYGFEANGVRPSGLDLVLTPASGLLLGEARYFVWSGLQRLRPSALRGVLSALVDPLGDLERALGTPC
jgi:hypothetical protein